MNRQLKAFSAEIKNNHQTLNREHAEYKDLPGFSNVETSDVMKN
jgi:hypothetical protein